MADIRKTKELLFQPVDERLFPKPTLIEKRWKVERLTRALAENAELSPTGDVTLTISAEELGSVFRVLEEYLEAEEELGTLRLVMDHFKEAYRIFKQPGTFQQRASRVLKHLYMHSGKRRADPNKATMIHDYIDLTHDGMPKWEAIERIQKQFGLQSPEAAYKALERIKSKIPGLRNKRILPSSMQPTTDKS